MYYTGKRGKMQSLLWNTQKKARANGAEKFCSTHPPYTVIKTDTAEWAEKQQEGSWQP